MSMPSPDAHPAPDRRGNIELLRMLTKRLERLSVDSIWARRANGLRGSLVKALAAADEGTPPALEHLNLLIEHSFEILSKAAREIPDRENLLWQDDIKKDINHE